MRLSSEAFFRGRAPQEMRLFIIETQKPYEFSIFPGSLPPRGVISIKAWIRGSILTKRIDPSELGQLIDEYASPLALYASQWAIAPEDCVQEAFIQLAALPDRPDNPVAWLFRVVRNRALNQVRSQQRQSAREKSVARLGVDRQEPSRQMKRTEEQSKLSRVLEQLNKEDRELVVLRIWGGLAWQEIAELTGTSSSSAQRRYVAALEKMKQRMETKCPTNPD